MIQELKALLRIEESGLSFMKKMRAHQRMPIKVCITSIFENYLHFNVLTHFVVI